MTRSLMALLALTAIGGCASAGGQVEAGSFVTGELVPGVYDFSGTMRATSRQQPGSVSRVVGGGVRAFEQTGVIYAEGTVEVLPNGGTRVLHTSHPGVRLNLRSNSLEGTMSASVLLGTERTTESTGRCLMYERSNGGNCLQYETRTYEREIWGTTSGSVRLRPTQLSMR